MPTKSGTRLAGSVMVGAGSTLSAGADEDSPFSGTWLLTNPHTVSSVSTASRIRIAASRLRRLSRWLSSAGSFLGFSGSGCFMLRVSSWVYSEEERARNSCGTVWMRSTGLSRRPYCSTSET